MTDKNKARIHCNATRAKTDLLKISARLDKCVDAADFESPEHVIIRNIEANIAEAARDLQILINRTKP